MAGLCSESASLEKFEEDARTQAFDAPQDLFWMLMLNFELDGRGGREGIVASRVLVAYFARALGLKGSATADDVEVALRCWSIGLPIGATQSEFSAYFRAKCEAARKASGDKVSIAFLPFPFQFVPCST